MLSNIETLPYFSMAASYDAKLSAAFAFDLFQGQILPGLHYCLLVYAIQLSFAHKTRASVADTQAECLWLPDHQMLPQTGKGSKRKSLVSKTDRPVTAVLFSF